jgi:hypothetical protein
MSVEHAASPFVAIGVLSSAITYETGRTVADKCRERRERIRAATRRFPELGRTVIQRFLLAANFSRRASARTQTQNEILQARAHDEARTHGDITFLDMVESFHLCAWKKIRE